ncbi:MAG: ATP-dependent DNA ligase [Burkholderiaceae bacterium]|nr:ATP-dependent DNA ligase [Burkholderiaceae bacterium]
MRRFATLYAALDASTSTEAKLQALVDHLGQAPPADAAWAVYLLAGGKPRQTVATALLRRTAMAAAGLPDWLFEASYAVVGDLAETIAHVLPPPSRHSELGLAQWMEQRLLPLRGAAPEAQAEALRSWWDELPAEQRFLLVKLIGGGFRVGVSKLLVQRALARHAGLDPALVAQRMMGWTDGRTPPSAERLQRLLAPVAADAVDGQDQGRPLPFFLAHALEAGLSCEQLAQRLGPAADWLAEWKYDGIRAQLLRHGGRSWLWSRGEELMDGRFPEVEAAALAHLPEGCVLDGELLVWPAGADRPAPFQQLQTRLNRRTLSRRLLAEAPVVFVAYDLLAESGQDLRSQPLRQRRARLQALLAAADPTCLRLSPAVAGADWAGRAAQRQRSRALGVEGLMLKPWDSVYGLGRSRPAPDGWWKWKIEPLRADGVLIYAQAGHGRRAGLYTDYTFAVWNRTPRDAAEAQAVLEAINRREPPTPGGLQLVAFAKAYSGLSDAEFAQVDREIRAQTLERFGPVRSVRPTLVMELGFEGLQPSARHKSGLAVRFPRMLRLRSDKPVHEADSLDTLKTLLECVAPPLNAG